VQRPAAVKGVPFHPADGAVGDDHQFLALSVGPGVFHKLQPFALSLGRGLAGPFASRESWPWSFRSSFQWLPQTPVVGQSFRMKTSPFGNAWKVAAGMPKFTARTSAGWPASHCERFTVSQAPELKTIRIRASSEPTFSREWP
jgi:hypothetical protein